MKKKVTYLLIVMFAMSVAFTSCKKDPILPPEPTETLAELYPDWTNLTWVSTDGDSYVNKYPKLNITIVDNLVSVFFTYFTGDITCSYSEMLIDGTKVSLNTSTSQCRDIKFYNYSKIGTQIQFTYDSNHYVLNIN